MVDYLIEKGLLDSITFYQTVDELFVTSSNYLEKWTNVFQIGSILQWVLLKIIPVLKDVLKSVIFVNKLLDISA